MTSTVDDLVTRMVARAEKLVPTVEGADFRSQCSAYAVVLQPDGPDGPGDEPGSVTAAVAAVEALGVAGAAPGVCYAMTSQLFGLRYPLHQVLSAPQRQWARDAGIWERLLCHALTEEGGGSDPLAMTTTAQPEDDGSYLLTGRKAFVTAAPVADLALVFARTRPGRSPFALTPFLVDLHAPGVRRSAPFPKNVLTEVPMGALDFEDVRLPASAVVGEEGAGLAVLTLTTNWERALLPAYAIGLMRRVLDRTVAWARGRTQFGRPMGASHLVAGRVADMAMALHRSRALVRAIAGRLDAGEPLARLAEDAALTKISVAEDYLAFTQHAAVLGGVRSFVEETGLTTDLLSPMAASVYAGPNDLLRISVARSLGLPVEN